MEALPRVIDKIIAAKGCVVPDEDTRSGRRQVKAWSKGGKEIKARRNFQCKATLASSLPYHPDIIEAKALIKAERLPAV